MEKNRYLDIIFKIGKITNTYSSYDQSQREYYEGGEKFHEKEVHLLKYIIDYPEKNMTEIAKDTARTKSSVSQVVKRLCDKGLLEMIKDENDKRNLIFKPTEKGLKLDKAHREYDLTMAIFLSRFLEKYTTEQLDIFLDMLDAYDEFQNGEYNLKDVLALKEESKINIK